MATEWFDQRRKPLRQDRPIILEAKQTGERSAGNPHAAFDEAGAGNVARPRWCDTRRRKSEPTGNTNFGLNRRVSPRPYLQIHASSRELQPPLKEPRRNRRRAPRPWPCDLDGSLPLRDVNLVLPDMVGTFGVSQASPSPE